MERCNGFFNGHGFYMVALSSVCLCTMQLTVPLFLLEKKTFEVYIWDNFIFEKQSSLQKNFPTNEMILWQGLISLMQGKM